MLFYAETIPKVIRMSSTSQNHTKNQRMPKLVHSPQKPKITQQLMTEGEPETVNHCLSVYSLSEVETYLIDQGTQFVDRQHTCVGSVHVKANGSTVKQLAIFDNCSSDHWCLNSLAKSLGAKVLPTWQGWVRTMTGRK